jgi:hypothetical protein
MLEIYNNRVIRGPECWGWGGYRNRAGYGVLTIPSTTSKSGYTSMLVHRLSHLLYKGPIGEGMVVRHACDNPICSNPDHLSLGTPNDNVQDTIKRGRTKYRSFPGALNHNAKLTTHQIEEIRASYQRGHKSRPGAMTLKALAEKYGVGISQIHRILRRKSW